MNLKKCAVYLGVPVAAGLVLNGMYFSGNIVLQRIVSPKLPPLPLDAWREFGLLENLQNAVLLVMLAAALLGARRAAVPLVRWGFLAVSAAALFVLLEEVDYFSHWIDFARHPASFQWFQPAAEWDPAMAGAIDLTIQPNSLHNRLSLTEEIKFIAESLTLLCLVVLPLARARVRNPWLRYLTPDPHILLTVAAMVALRFLTHTLADWEQAAVAAPGSTRELGSISLNLSEFRELNTYYAFLLYVAQLAFVNRPPGTSAPADETQA